MSFCGWCGTSSRIRGSLPVFITEREAEGLTTDDDRLTMTGCSQILGEEEDSNRGCCGGRNKRDEEVLAGSSGCTVEKDRSPHG